MTGFDWGLGSYEQIAAQLLPVARIAVDQADPRRGSRRVLRQQPVCRGGAVAVAGGRGAAGSVTMNVEITVADTGIGIAADDLERILRE